MSSFHLTLTNVPEAVVFIDTDEEITNHHVVVAEFDLLSNYRVEFKRRVMQYQRAVWDGLKSICKG